MHRPKAPSTAGIASRFVARAICRHDDAVLSYDGNFALGTGGKNGCKTPPYLRPLSCAHASHRVIPGNATKDQPRPTLKHTGRLGLRNYGTDPYPETRRAGSFISSFHQLPLSIFTFFLLSMTIPPWPARRQTLRLLMVSSDMYIEHARLTDRLHHDQSASQLESWNNRCTAACHLRSNACSKPGHVQ